MSIIRNIAPPTERAHTNNMPMTVALAGAKSPNVKKSNASQKTRITRKAWGKPFASFLKEQPMGLRNFPAYRDGTRLQLALGIGFGRKGSQFILNRLDTEVASAGVRRCIIMVLVDPRILQPRAHQFRKQTPRLLGFGTVMRHDPVEKDDARHRCSQLRLGVIECRLCRCDQKPDRKC